MNKVKRRRDKYNPYTLENNNVITFCDSKGQQKSIAISNELYNIFNNFELYDLKMLNEYDRHIEHMEQSDEMLYKKAMNNTISLEESVLNKIFFELIINEIEKLPDVQKRRIKMYFFDDMKLKDIAKIEGCSIRAIKYSIDIGLSKILKTLKL